MGRNKKKSKDSFGGFFNYFFLFLLIVIIGVAYSLFETSFFTGKFISEEAEYNLSGYSKPVDIFDGNKTVFSISPDQDVLISQIKTFKATVNHSGAYIYRKGYYWSQESNRWINFTFPQATVGNSNWITDFASTNITVNVSKDFKNGENLFITYSCKKQSDVWKCGCNSFDNSSCDKWMLQMVNVSGTIDSCVNNSDCYSNYSCVNGLCVLDGIVDDVYKIYNCTDLQNIKNNLNASYELANDIDCSETRNWNNGTGFEPIGEFSGTLNGEGHVIEELYINMTGYTNAYNLPGVAFVKNNSGILSNLVFSSIDIFGGRYGTGGITSFNYGYVLNSSVSGVVKSSFVFNGGVQEGEGRAGISCTNYGSIQKSSSAVNVGRYSAPLVANNYGNISGSFASANNIGDGEQAGLVLNNYGSISSSYSSGNVVGGNNVGGLVATNWGGGIIQNCYAIGNVSGSRSVGGLVGQEMGGGIISNSYSIGKVIVSGGDGGGLLGLKRDSSAQVLNSYYNNQTSGQTTSAGGEGKTTAEMKTLGTFVGWDFANTWAINNGYPYLIYFGEEANNNLETLGVTTYGIYNCTDLQNIKNVLSSNFILQNNIDCSVTSGWNNGTGFEPIEGFSGTIDGAGYEISNLYINRPGESTIGLFGQMTGNISNVRLINVNILSGDHLIGGLVGYQQGGIISNSSSSGNVAGGVSSYNVGGLVGWSSGTIVNCYSTGRVSAETSSVGGLVGATNSGGVISHSYSTASVTSSGQATGGLAGASYAGVVSNSYATGNVVSSNNHVGGLIGISNSIVTNCYAKGNVSSSRVSYGYVGGLIGSGSGTINNSYSTGKVIGSTPVGGLVGSGCVASNSYWDTSSSGQVTSFTGVSKTTEQMKQQATYLDWDFANVWAINLDINGGYPYLR